MASKVNRREVVSESDPLDRPATPEEIEMVERMLEEAGPTPRDST
jgi:hypothetical protein